ncbi:MAG: hypothetical protein COS14_04445 [Bacteroidetes bacterium CG02_land_8_20_14_3_00_31_25]|nr:DUF2442 domain-containing protein [Bacteroidota bacterium]PIV60935.1 MAG: hypothetical protein COS14_04445 [Bacteroidetes bacterium CG02_land_8_20_14_3_00_31_25]PIX35775.1 MAG: hypothetical protein COZ59_04640 [Bacteroidetes bacterium CG_4_8_14_3_um_filter_31_14]PIY02179.1 MAG: hypothetical protein COZ21_15500 [Bacteroidetes bacterium CG_4_10_14_3_um_filter_31_20]
MKNIKIEGFWNIIPKIKKISFHIKGKIQVDFEDGRSIIIPLLYFPSIKKLNTKERKKWYLFGNGFSFEDSNEVFHIEQILGNFQKYKHETK